MSRLRLVHVIAPALIGGKQTRVLNLARAEQDEGYPVRIVALLYDSEPRHPFVVRARELGLDIVTSDVRRGEYSKERTLVRDAGDEFRADVLHTHGYRADLLHGALGPLRPRTAIVTTIHGHAGTTRSVRFFQRLRLAALRRFDAVIAVSDPLASLATAHGAPPSSVFCIPVVSTRLADAFSRDEARERLGLPLNGECIGWIGRFSPEKGADVLLDAIALCRNAAIVSMIGDGPLRDSLQSRAINLGIDARCRWHGIVPFAARCFKAFDLIVLSSRSEGTPMVLLESIALGVPLIASAVGGIPLAAEDGGVTLVSPESPSTLAHAIDEALSHPEWSAGRRNAARAHSPVVGNSTGDASPWLSRYVAAYSHAHERFRHRYC